MVDAAPLKGHAQADAELALPLEHELEHDVELLPVHLALRSVDYHVRTGFRKEKQILFGVNADFQPGQLTAVMGPSGAGKTTVLNLLTQNAAGRIGGGVLANGRPLHRGLKTLTNLVPQEDILLPSLTVRETMGYAAELRMPTSVTPAMRQQRIDALIADLGLTECLDTPVGSAEKRGISGGQRKRVSIALELLTRPSVLVLDEPTSGLDSKAAEDVCSMLRKIALQGHTVICTIHQPSWKVFAHFSALLLLAKGEVVYRGLPVEAPTYFEKLGHPSPMNENPVDHVLRVIQEQAFSRFESDLRAPAELLEVPATRYANSLCHQTRVLFRRNVYDMVKDKEKLLSLCIMKLTVSVLIGICWWSTASPADWKKAFTITGCLFMLTMQGIMDNIMDTIMRFPTSKLLYLREYKNGSYSSFSWTVAYLTTVWIFNTISAIMLLVPAYLMIPLRLDANVFFTALLCVFLSSCLGCTAGVLMGTLAKDLQTAQGMMLPLIVPLILFCGYIIPHDSIPVVFRWVYYINPFQWSFSILRLNQFDGWVFAECPAATDFGAFCACTDAHPQCTGQDYLKYVNLDPADYHIGNYFLYMACFLVVLLVPTFLAIRMKGNSKTG